MPRLCAITTQVPTYRYSQAELKEFTQSHFASSTPDFERLHSVFEHAGIEHRYLTKPFDWYLAPRTLADNSKIYQEAAVELSASCITKILSQQSLEPKEIDYLLYINTTGLATPSIDARLINVLRFKPAIRRTPIWGLGCAGGAQGLAHAYHHLLGHPKERVLVVSCELCSLTFIPDDYSASNFVAAALFGDGAAAALLVGDEADGDGIEVLGTQSTLFPDSLDVMGWNIDTRGLQVVFAQRIPDIVREHTKAQTEAFLRPFNLTTSDVAEFLIHPGGTKVLKAYRQALSLNGNSLRFAEQTLKDFGNMSSATVLFVIERFLQEKRLRPGYGLVSALGPGFSSESVLLKW